MGYIGIYRTIIPLNPTESYDIPMMFPLYSHKTTNSLGLVEPADMLRPCLALFGLPLRKDHLTLHSTAEQHSTAGG